MYAWEAVETTLDYIEEHYDEALDVDRLASVAHLSPYYFQRIFYRLVKKNAAEYVRLRRLAKAAGMLKNSDRRILGIAVACGFQSHSHFSRAFRETYGVTPGEYRRETIRLDHFLRPDLKLAAVIAQEDVPLIAEGMVLEIRRERLSREVIFAGKSRLAPVKELGQPKVNLLSELWNELPWQDLTGGRRKSGGRGYTDARRESGVF